jgi:DNA-binding MarR family transcriptional regulator
LRGAGPEGLPCREIGERMITHDPDITRLLNRLEDRGFVERTRARDDRRVIYGKITADGLKLLREMDRPIEKHGREMLRHVGQDRLKKLIGLLELVRGGSVFHRRDAESAEKGS